MWAGGANDPPFRLFLRRRDVNVVSKHFHDSRTVVSLSFLPFVSVQANNNKLTNMADLTQLSGAGHLNGVYLEKNPLAEHPRYRALVKEGTQLQ